MAKINTVLFDFDGTIMDTNNVILQSWQHTFRTVEGKERPREEILSTFGEPLYVTMEKKLPQISVEEGAAIYRGFHYDHFTDLISLFPGIIELLEELKKRGIKIGLVTSRLRHTTEIGLNKFDMMKYFDSIVTCDDTEKFKPDPEPALVALQQLDAKPEETLMVGDSLYDILCARGAGIRSALVGWALAVSEEEKTGKDAPDYIIEKAEDLLEIL
ncbi:pyrophosphatase PpaX [Anoxybacterium hadale]|uniref:pyrophosphatase PpaX n=1 Tax=Anoxybacterium hadale TaxID=3408580 RepID=UPI003B00CF07